MSFTEKQLKDAKAFVDLLKRHPDLVHDPNLSFFKEYLVSLDATLPEKRCAHGFLSLTCPSKPKEPEKVVEEEPEEEAGEQDPELWTADGPGEKKCELGLLTFQPAKKWETHTKNPQMRTTLWPWAFSQRRGNLLDNKTSRAPFRSSRKPSKPIQPKPFSSLKEQSAT